MFVGDAPLKNTRASQVMWRGGGEGRVPSLMTAAVKRKVSNSFSFTFVFDVCSMGHSA
jgi:hypothetical protein